MGPAKGAKVSTNDSTLGDPAAEAGISKNKKKAFSYRSVTIECFVRHRPTAATRSYIKCINKFELFLRPRPALDPAGGSAPRLPSVPPAPN